MSMMDKQNLMYSRISLFFYFLCPWWINKIQCKTFYVYFMSMKGMEKGKNIVCPWWETWREKREKHEGEWKNIVCPWWEKREKHEGEWKKGKKMENEPCQKLAEACHVMKLCRVFIKNINEETFCPSVSEWLSEWSK